MTGTEFGSITGAGRIFRLDGKPGPEFNLRPGKRNSRQRERGISRSAKRPGREHFAAALKIFLDEAWAEVNVELYQR